jgi:threonylcarbamoyladenosine tRNA methylthiotransferase MtaB
LKRVFIQSFGCRASQADGAAIEAGLENRGAESVSDAADADLIVINTCTVTHSADVDARRVIRGMHRDHPQAEILVTGCYAQRAPDDLAALPGVRWVVGNSHKAQIADLVTVQHEPYHGETLVGEITRTQDFAPTPVGEVRPDRTRPNLKVQDGCSNACSFCIIPSVRGPSRSASLASVLGQMRELASRYAEVVLTGINLGRWGRDLESELRFIDLLKAILADCDVQRIRISSVEPMDWSDELLDLIATEPRIAKHVHIPLQSGSDAVLKRMFRKYRTRHYAGRLATVRRLMPEAAIGADVMTGFPGETEGEFADTVQFIRDQPLTYLHVFSYSERPGTRAAERGEAVPMGMRHERTRVLRELSDEKNRQFCRTMIGKTLSAITLEQPFAALSSNFLRVAMNQHREPNRLVGLKIGSVTDLGVREASPLPVLR